MKHLSDIWRKLEYVTGIFETLEGARPYKTPTAQELLDIQHDLRDCANALQPFIDKLPK